MKESFFKLPLIIAFSYFIYCVGSIIFMMFQLYGISVIDFSFFLPIILNDFINLIPSMMFIIFISAIVLNKFNITLTSRKNKFLVFVISIVVYFITFYLIDKYSVYDVVFSIFTVDAVSVYANLFTIDSELIVMIYQKLIIRFVHLGGIMLLLLSMIFILQGLFDKVVESELFKKNRCAKIHSYLFSLLFVFLLFSLLQILTQSYYIYMHSYVFKNFLPNFVQLIAIIFFFNILNTSIMSKFNKNLNSLHVIKLCIAVIFSLTITIFIVLLIVWGISFSWLIQDNIAVIYYGSTILLLILACSMSSFMSKLFFSATTSRDSTDNSSIVQ